MHPDQQHGRRLPSMSSVIVRLICSALVSGFLTVMIQQIHSLRANGVRSCHLSRADSSDNNAIFKSDGILWATPFANTCVVTAI